MRNNNDLLASRQQWLQFPNNKLWEQLPEETRLRCQELLVLLLRTVVNRQEQQERSQHERED